MKRANQEEILDRRIEMLRYGRSGQDPKEWAPLVAAKYDTTIKAVKKDWSKRNCWMPLLLKTEDAKALALELLFDMQTMYWDACQLYREAKDVKAKTQAAWLKIRTIQMRGAYLKELGALKRLKSDFEDQAQTHARKLLEEKYPFLKGEKDRVIRTLACKKSNGLLTKEDLERAMIPS